MVTGYSGGSLNPSGLVRREEMATMLERAMARTLVLAKLPNDKVATALSRFGDAQSAKNYGVQTASVYIVDTPPPATALAGV